MEQDVKFFDTVENGQHNFWEVQVNIDDKTFKFKVDTGAEITVISEATWNSLYSAKPDSNQTYLSVALIIPN